MVSRRKPTDKPGSREARSISPPPAPPPAGPSPLPECLPNIDLAQQDLSQLLHAADSLLIALERYEDQRVAVNGRWCWELLLEWHPLVAAVHRVETVLSKLGLAPNVIRNIKAGSTQLRGLLKLRSWLCNARGRHMLALDLPPGWADRPTGLWAMPEQPAQEQIDFAQPLRSLRLYVAELHDGEKTATTPKAPPPSPSDSSQRQGCYADGCFRWGTVVVRAIPHPQWLLLARLFDEDQPRPYIVADRDLAVAIYGAGRIDMVTPMYSVAKRLRTTIRRVRGSVSRPRKAGGYRFVPFPDS
jgi:hypothetical protein